MPEVNPDKKEQILEKIKNIDNPLVLQQLEKTLQGVDTYQRVLQHPRAHTVLTNSKTEDYQVKSHLQLPAQSAVERYDHSTSRPIFLLACLTLIVIGILVTSVTEDRLSDTFQHIYAVLLPFTGLLYLIFAADYLIMWYYKGKSSVNRQTLLFRTLALFFPPIRIGSRDLATGRHVWLPFWHWSQVTEGLFAELKKRFVIPMILIALLIVPVLVIEWKFMDEVQERWPHLNAALILELVQTVIWIGFTFEFLLMIAVSDNKLAYCKKNWLDLLIILLPFVSFLRTFRFSQLARLKYATRSFKLRGIITKTRQGLILIDFVRKILKVTPESDLKRLHKMLLDNERERLEIDEKMREVLARLDK